ncbi:MAG TPA: serine/threonine protein phosphatase [Cyanobacteria bacterium UBA11149]|nr:serine/threonine protein phosphatase [Cyanobacteria bacterium UBA11367]HBE58719.1 serine/threonine protein phosphatase [Cyanobacteria bacterium UBA11366]HBK62869.1 serine/threonine protein phosphatase [Cyanobacteria bacterium UBA11166]HBR76743.1 serine/threonine protein phosphatase [Cyanobacteria bacterium UBA11159]HBS68541.1 serine/threonine protein phosphatase [Cyanobacteria bacterium UBA11153]HBW87438.1 serine/threonine protein phosphatase [Cyanobacteria bacterium UBA11149]HCA93516.1 se
MANSAGTIQCPNYSCQAVNHQSDKFCHSCGTPLIKRYLWAIGSGIDGYGMGSTMADRYLVVGKRILLDTTPAIEPDMPEEVSPEFLPYLKLSPHRLHIPQVYGWVKVAEKRHNSEIWLLEDVPISPSGELYPQLTNVWHNTPGIRQLNWLWQWANLWQPLLAQGVVRSLTEPSSLRVAGSHLRLLELQSDRKDSPTLQQLGQFWLTLVEGASPEIKRYFQEVCTQLTQKQIITSEQLVTILDRGLYDCARSQKRTYQIFTLTDSGPSRDGNEDACYPASGELIVSETDGNTLAIVCDGIGGHPGGEIASPLAIYTLYQKLENMAELLEEWHPESILQALEEAACAANDAISQQNDRENRSDRQRMGTTLVMATPFAHEMYITHVGDSRVYWVTKEGCHQVTQDDDLASREVRLGYSLYRNALQHRGSGSLVQALGISSSSILHPTVQRFAIDESCLFLLCSDGLSDYDRVEQYWEKEIIPILEGGIDLPTAARHLIDIANHKNGHDNATIALVYCEVTSSPTIEETELSPPPIELPPPENQITAIAKTRQIVDPLAKKRPWWLFLCLFFFLGLGGVIGAMKFGGINLVSRLISISRGDIASTKTPPNPSEIENIGSPSVSLPAISTPTPEATPTVALLDPAKLTERKELIQSINKDIALVERPDKQEKLGLVPTGSILQVIGNQRHEEQEWVGLKICSLGTGNFEGNTSITDEKLLKKGETGWVKLAEVSVEPSFQGTEKQKVECAGK